jgi:hypothetical protein
MGTSPIEYLTGWRRLVAADKLISCNDSVAGIALSVGYESESAFGAAFKKIMGYSHFCKSPHPRSQRFSRHLGRRAQSLERSKRNSAGEQTSVELVGRLARTMRWSASAARLGSTFEPVFHASKWLGEQHKRHVLQAGPRCRPQIAATDPLRLRSGGDGFCWRSRIAAFCAR